MTTPYETEIAATPGSSPAFKIACILLSKGELSAVEFGKVLVVAGSTIPPENHDAVFAGLVALRDKAILTRTNLGIPEKVDVAPDPVTLLAAVCAESLKGIEADDIRKVLVNFSRRAITYDIAKVQLNAAINAFYSEIVQVAEYHRLRGDFLAKLS